MTAAPGDLAARLVALRATGRRALVAVAGPPGSGKSTLADALARACAAQGRPARVVPMDGFHLDNRLLRADGLLARKGAPETFDLGGFSRLIAALERDETVHYPLFDRTRDIAIAGAGRIGAADDLVIVEGNYLLFDVPGWRDLARHWSLAVWLHVPAEVLRQRLIDRWLAEGLEPPAARARAEGNDLANAALVNGARLAADVEIGDPSR